VALAVSPGGRLALLSWATEGADLVANVRFLAGDKLGAPLRLDKVRRPYSLGWVEDDRLAVLVAGWSEAAVYDVSASLASVAPGASVDPVGDLYPLSGHDGGPLVHGFSLPAAYPTAGAPQPLHHLSLPSYAASGSREPVRAFDSFDVHTVWHRVYLEAAIPSHASIVVWLAASDDPAAPGTFFPHTFGQSEPALPVSGPQGAWVREASEIPFHPGFLPCPRRPGESGLFTALVQRTGLTVRSLRGRYLFARVDLAADGRTTPELAALRVYGSRFSYRDRYLPELYRESVFAPESELPGPATRSDFLERFLASFEGVLTSLEDRVAFSWMLTDPRVAPEEALPWLGSFIGFTFDPLVAPAKRRVLLENASELYRRRGTLRGVQLAIDLVTDGMVSSGEVVVLEDWRLRRTFATILGAHLEDNDDPLLLATISSGNSYVGDTFFLGDENRKEFLAIFRADLQTTVDEQSAIARLYDQFAHRLTLFVHHQLDDQTRALIERIAGVEKPAHVQLRTLAASESFVIGLASLLGVQTFIDKAKPPQPATIDETQIGLEGYLDQPPALDPRLGGGESIDAPTARLPAQLRVALGDSVVLLDGAGSRPPAGRELVKFIWRRVT
jgi:phage tail-like protein